MILYKDHVIYADNFGRQTFYASIAKNGILDIEGVGFTQEEAEQDAKRKIDELRTNTTTEL